MRKVNLLRSITILSIAIMFMGCLKPNQSEVSEGAWSEPFIGTFNIDGSGVDLLTSVYNNSLSGARPYFVKDIAGNDEEIILLDLLNSIELMSLDGNNRRTILDSLGGVEYFNQERTKMLLQKDGEIYLCKVDGSELTNITNTPDIYEREPSFSYDEESIIYTALISSGNLSISNIYEYQIATNEVSILYDYEEIPQSYSYSRIFEPAKLSSEKISYKFLTDPDIVGNYTVNSLMKYDLQEDFVEELCTDLAYINYSHSKEFLAYNRSEDGYLVNLLTGDITSFDCGSTYPSYSFSESDRYLCMDIGVLDLHSNTKYHFSDSNFFKKYNTVEQVHMNMNEDRLIGIVRFLHY